MSAERHQTLVCVVIHGPAGRSGGPGDDRKHPRAGIANRHAAALGTGLAMRPKSNK